MGIVGSKLREYKTTYLQRYIDAYFPSNNPSNSIKLKSESGLPWTIKNIAGRGILAIVNSPYFKYIGKKTVEMVVLNNETFKSSGIGKYYEGKSGDPYAEPATVSPRHFAAGWDFLAEKLYINSKEFTRDVITHELFHSLSSQKEEMPAKSIIIARCGIHAQLYSRENALILDNGAHALNEGFTEYLRVKCGGKIYPSHAYYPLYEAARSLVKTFGEKLLNEAYFEGKLVPFKKAIEGHYGEGSYEHLCYVTGRLNNNNSSISRKWTIPELKGFLAEGPCYYEKHPDWPLKCVRVNSRGLPNYPDLILEKVEATIRKNDVNPTMPPYLSAILEKNLLFQSELPEEDYNRCKF